MFKLNITGYILFETGVKVKRVRLLVIMNIGSITWVQKENENVHGAFKNCWVTLIIIFPQLSGALALAGFLKILLIVYVVVFTNPYSSIRLENIAPVPPFGIFH